MFTHTSSVSSCVSKLLRYFVSILWAIFLSAGFLFFQNTYKPGFCLQKFTVLEYYPVLTIAHSPSLWISDGLKKSGYEALKDFYPINTFLHLKKLWINTVPLFQLLLTASPHFRMGPGPLPLSPPAPGLFTERVIKRLTQQRVKGDYKVQENSHTGLGWPSA